MIEPILKDEKLLADISAAKSLTADAMAIWWLGQSTFLVQHAGRHLLFDPYLSESLTRKYHGTEKPHVRMTGRSVAPEALGFVDVITSTHNHTDHLDADTLVPLVRAAQASGRAAPALVVPAANEAFAGQRLAAAPPTFAPIDAGQDREVAGFRFHAVPSAHDQLTTDDKGRHVYLGYVVRVGRWTIYHSGDGVVYPGLADAVRPFNVDLAILPINGQVGNMGGVDAARLAKEIGAKVVIPCHYEMFEFNTASPDAFIAECRRLGQRYRLFRCGERWIYPEKAS